jgi:hypothetical protein
MSDQLYTVAEDDPEGQFKRGQKVTAEQVAAYCIPTVEDAVGADAAELKAMSDELSQIAQRQVEITARLEAGAKAWARWDGFFGEFKFVRLNSDGTMRFQAGGGRIVNLTADDIAEAVAKLQVPRHRKSAWSAACRDWMEAIGMPVERVRYDGHDREGVGVWYWTADGQDDLCGMPWEYFELRGKEARMRFARSYDREYRSYRCCQCGGHTTVANPEGLVLKERIEHYCESSRCKTVRPHLREELIEPFARFPLDKALASA